ncbi:MAG: uroporphyrinogen-III synthase [Mesorhizobium sp.]|jgi:uroporphyrinogen-III synthase
MPVRVLVTRPEPGASRTARRLRELGFEPVVLPLTEIRPLKPSRFPDAAAIDAVTVTSANAIRHAPPEIISAFISKPLYAVGRKTAEAARNSGFTTVIEGAGDAADLVREMSAALLPGSRVLYLCGRIRREALESALIAAGLSVGALETYDTRTLDYQSDFVFSALQDKPVAAALVLSAVAAEALLTLRRRPGLSYMFESTRYFCLSARTAGVLSQGGVDQVYAAAMPDEDALISLLERES